MNSSSSGACRSTLSGSSGSRDMMFSEPQIMQTITGRFQPSVPSSRRLCHPALHFRHRPLTSMTFWVVGGPGSISVSRWTAAASSSLHPPLLCMLFFNLYHTRRCLRSPR